jgi:AcrR family transcriptional regulator
MRDRILQATIQTLCLNGYTGTTARAIASVGGFAPGVIYYYFSDLDDLLVETVSFTSGQRMQRYRAVLPQARKATEAVALLRELYEEDLQSGHIAAVQELVAGCRPGSKLAARIAEVTREWEEMAADVLRNLLRGLPFSSLLSMPVLARSSVAFYLGMQTLSHVDGDEGRIEQMFSQANRLARVLDRVPRLYLRKT